MKTVLLCLLVLVALTAHAQKPERIITIGGALTEIVYALDAQDLLVGSDTTSYYPPEAEQLPKVGYQRALSAEGIVSLDPDLVILTEEAGPPLVLKQLELAKVKTAILKAGRSLEDVKLNIWRIAELLDKEKEASVLIREIDVEHEKLFDATTRKPARRVMFILQHGGGSPMVAGKATAADSIISLSGALNVVQDYTGYKPLTPEAAVALRPDIILITTQGLKQAGGKKSVLQAPGVSLTPAAKKGNLIAMDSLLILGFGPRTAQAALELKRAYEGL